MSCALTLALLSAGNSIAARIAMIAMTTSNSIKVKALQSAKLLAAAEGLWIIDSSSRGQPGRADSKHIRLRFVVFSQILVFGRFMGLWFSLSLPYVVVAFTRIFHFSNRGCASTSQCDVVETFGPKIFQKVTAPVGGWPGCGEGIAL